MESERSGKLQKLKRGMGNMIKTMEDAKKFFEIETMDGHGIAIPGAKVKCYQTKDGKWIKYSVFDRKEEETTTDEIIQLIYDNREIINEKYFDD